MRRLRFIIIIVVVVLPCIPVIPHLSPLLSSLSLSLSLSAMSSLPALARGPSSRWFSRARASLSAVCGQTRDHLRGRHFTARERGESQPRGDGFVCVGTSAVSVRNEPRICSPEREWVWRRKKERGRVGG